MAEDYRRHPRRHGRRGPRRRRAHARAFQALPRPRNRHQGPGRFRLRCRQGIRAADPQARCSPAIPTGALRARSFRRSKAATREYRWLVDPIDGTTNFINGQHYTISIALRRGNRDRLRRALQSRRRRDVHRHQAARARFSMASGSRSASATDVGLMAVGTSIPTNNRFTFDGFYERLEQIRRRSASSRTIGSSANSCAYRRLRPAHRLFRGIRPRRLGRRRAAGRGGGRHRHRLVGARSRGLRANRLHHRRQPRDPRLSASTS